MNWSQFREPDKSINLQTAYDAQYPADYLSPNYDDAYEMLGEVSRLQPIVSRQVAATALSLAHALSWRE